MKYNSRGDVVIGYLGGLGVFVKRRGQPQEQIAGNLHNGAKWINDDHIVYQDYTQDPNCWIKCTDGRDPVNVRASELDAGGGHWFSFLASNPTKLYLDGVKLPLDGAGKTSMGNDGTYAWSPSYHDDKGVIIKFPDGTEKSFLTDPVGTTTCLDKDAVAWFSGGKTFYVWNGTERKVVQAPFAFYAGRLFRKDGAIWFVGHHPSSGTVLFGIDDPSRGYHIAPGINTFWPDAVQVDGVTYVAWSSTQGETSTSMRETTVTGEPVKFSNAPNVIKVQKFSRPIFYAPYDTHSEREGISPNIIANVAFPDKSKVGTTTLPLIAAYDTFVPAEENRTLYYYIHSSRLTDANTKLQFDYFKDKPEKPFILYLDSRNWPDTLPTWMPQDRLFLAVQAYPNAGETPSEFWDSMKDVMDKVSKFKLPIVLTPAFYARGTMQLDLETLKSMMPVYADLVARYYVVGIMPFSDMRDDGMKSMPELYTESLKLYNMVPARPNRFQYWTPSDHETAKQALKDQVAYDIAGFSPKQRDELQKLIEEHY